MSKYDKPLTPEQIAALKDSDIDFSDIPELDEQFWKQAQLVEPDRTPCASSAQSWRFSRRRVEGIRPE